MRCHFLQHVPFEGPAYIHTWCHENKVRLDRTALYKGEPLPSMNDFDMLFVMGGPMGVHDTGEYPWLIEEKRFLEKAIGAEKRIIGICLGAQLIADVLGAPVTRNPEKEIGWFPLTGTDTAEAPLLPKSFYAFHWHGDTFGLPAGARHLAKSEACENQAFLYDERILALQFHLESTALSIKDILLNCADELVPGKWIQSADSILDTQWEQESNLLMGRIIETLSPET